LQRERPLPTKKLEKELSQKIIMDKTIGESNSGFLEVAN
jgi:hypothetical protein